MITTDSQEIVIMSEVQDKNALMMENAQLILSDDRYRPDDWRSLALVYNFLNGRENIYGYVFYPDGKWEARGLRENAGASLDKMLELQAAMERETGKKWMKALVLINREDESLDIKFEYDDPKKWVINPGDLEASVAALRP